jgi:hypothetical protein
VAQGHGEGGVIVNYTSAVLAINEECRSCSKELLDGELLAVEGPDGPDRLCMACLACDDPKLRQPRLVLARNHVYDLDCP